MYREFYFLIEAYIRTLTKKEVVYEIVMPLFVALAFPYIFNITVNKDIIASIINLMAIILGFVVATITILLTSGDNNLKLSKEFRLDKKVFGKDITLFRQLLILFFYIAFVAMIELIVSILTIYFGLYGKISTAINLFLIFHLILLSIRNLTNLFFIEFR